MLYLQINRGLLLLFGTFYSDQLHAVLGLSGAAVLFEMSMRHIARHAISNDYI